MAQQIALAGNCPMGCTSSLYVDDDTGRINCADEACPRPSAAHEILAETETEHVVELRGSTFTVKHPLRERLDDALLDCELGAWLKAQAGPPERPGRYRVTRHQPDPVSESRRMGQGPWDFEPLTA